MDTFILAIKVKGIPGSRHFMALFPILCLFISFHSLLSDVPGTEDGDQWQLFYLRLNNNQSLILNTSNIQESLLGG